MTSIFDSTTFNQNLFFPRPDYNSKPDSSEDHFIEVDEDVLLHSRVHINPELKVSLVYFHGNGEIVSDYDALAPFFFDLALEPVFVEYRGYGKSGGFPTLRDSLNDACIAYDSLKELGVLKEKVVVMGHSLGSAPAIELAIKRKTVDALIIESGYADPIPLVRRRGIQIGSITDDENKMFNNSFKIQSANCPALIMHGAQDDLIYPEEAELNFKNITNGVKHLAILDGVGHNDIFFAEDNSYFNSINRFLQEVKAQW